jgi:hypothetical protein
MIQLGPVGKISVGHVLDVNKKAFERALKDYDPFLYVKWNPKKMKGHGCWEIRRKPEFYSAVDVAELPDCYVVKLGLYENDLVHHVLDCAFLNYDQLRKIQEMDTCRYGSAKDWQDMLEQKTLDRQAWELSAGMKRRAEAAKEFKAQIRAMKQFVLDGGNPHRIAALWDQVSELE